MAIVDHKAQQLTPHANFRPKILQLLEDVAGKGFQPHIAQALRTPAEEANHVKNGTSRTMHSMHLPQKPDGLSWAADVVDIRYGWNPPSNAIWLVIGHSCMVHQVGWGGYFGLSAPERAELDAALQRQEWGYKGKLGWDPAHCQLPLVK